MATTEVMQPESALHGLCQKDQGEEAGHCRGRSSGDTGLEIETLTSRNVDELLEIVVQFIERQIDTVESVKSPTEVPGGIEGSHARQIEVCLMRFRTVKIPPVTVRDYLYRLHLHCPFSTAKLLALVYYLKTLDILYMEISKVLKQNTAHRLILTAVVIASKILDDRLIPQVRWSVVGGINLHQLHGLELAFFFLMNGKCWITETSLIQAGHLLAGSLDLTDIAAPLIRTSESEIIWSSVGNRCVNPSQAEGVGKFQGP